MTAELDSLGAHRFRFRWLFQPSFANTPRTCYENNWRHQKRFSVGANEGVYDPSYFGQGEELHL